MSEYTHMVVKYVYVVRENILFGSTGQSAQRTTRETRTDERKKNETKTNRQKSDEKKEKENQAKEEIAKKIKIKRDEQEQQQMRNDEKCSMSLSSVAGVCPCARAPNS